MERLELSFTYLERAIFNDSSLFSGGLPSPSPPSRFNSVGRGYVVTLNAGETGLFLSKGGGLWTLGSTGIFYVDITLLCTPIMKSAKIVIVSPCGPSRSGDAI